MLYDVLVASKLSSGKQRRDSGLFHGGWTCLSPCYSLEASGKCSGIPFTISENNPQRERNVARFLLLSPCSYWGVEVEMEVMALWFTALGIVDDG